MTHDLFCDVLDELSVQLERVVITELATRPTSQRCTCPVRRDSTVSARPSDAVALAVRVGCPIFAADEVLDRRRVRRGGRRGQESPEAVVEEFRQFIDQVSRRTSPPEQCRLPSSVVS